ncbi:glucoamylase family protein [Geofilum rubicundum]|uniref:glucoamylase family protein n=1 Tax=Geofilum rubicundum TaxID=472113 RepID=UPI0021CD84EF|nr:glucoamylase family protein [Geofilum rubicundum]
MRIWGHQIWGPYGFYDAFSEEYQWYPQRYLAIDQGPIAIMIENHRSALLWELFMQNSDVQSGLKRLGFATPHLRD